MATKGELRSPTSMVQIKETGKSSRLSSLFDFKTTLPTQ
ncbi:hypothetical protein VCHENC03_4800 [Vibrio sp. HENC-03]|nr:hypothetical protein VCHENC03_4800 [Vibrio sp. HENC-03]